MRIFFFLFLFSSFPLPIQMSRQLSCFAGVLFILTHSLALRAPLPLSLFHASSHHQTPGEEALHSGENLHYYTTKNYTWGIDFEKGASDKYQNQWDALPPLCLSLWDALLFNMNFQMRFASGEKKYIYTYEISVVRAAEMHNKSHEHM